MVKLTSAGLRHLVEKPGRHGDGAGLFFRTLGSGKSYWAYRFRVDGREREMSIGPFPEVSLAQARAKHMDLRRQVIIEKLDPLAERRAVKQTTRALKVGKPTFGDLADAHLETWPHLRPHPASRRGRSCSPSYARLVASRCASREA